jgi:hypothetical protein
VDTFLQVTGRACPAVAGYRFTSVNRLARDFDRGRFAAAFPPTKTYTGYRLPGEEGPAGAGLVTVHQGGQSRPLDPRFDLRRHADLNWGFGGSGPAQLDLALAADVTGDDDLARRVYQKLKFKLVGRLPQDGWALTEQQLRAAIQEIQTEHDRGRLP